MTRKDYVMIAAAIKANRHNDGLAWADAIAKSIASKWQSENQSFDRSRFLQACGVNGL